MASQIFRPASIKPILGLKKRKFLFSLYDALAFLFIISMLALISLGANDMNQSLPHLKSTPITLDWINLPKYAVYSTLRMFIAIFWSLIFSFIIATVAAKNKKAESIIIPILDILQSIPVLGFLTFTLTVFMGFFPQQQLGLELAAIFVIFTSQAWNMTFALYYSLKTVPEDLQNIADHFSLSGWQKFWRLEIPFAMPALIWNTVMSMSGGWFFIVASEAVSVGNLKIALPGIGSWLALAINQKNTVAIGGAIFTMAIIILLCDQLLFRPIIVWAHTFKMNASLNEAPPTSWFYNLIQKTHLAKFLKTYLSIIKNKILYIQVFKHTSQIRKGGPPSSFALIWDKIWGLSITILLVACALFLYHYLSHEISLSLFLQVLWLGSLTALRVVLLIVGVSLIWVPLGIYIGLRPQLTAWVQPLAQFLAAFPANVLFPIFVMIIVSYDLNPNIWLSPLMVLSAQWYIFFNVIAGASVFPDELKEATKLYKINSFLWAKKIMLPAILPFYITGALTASGGAWNASIVAELIHWGQQTVSAKGLGAYIAKSTEQGNTHGVILGVAVMCLFVVIINRLIWNKLYLYAIRHTR